MTSRECAPSPSPPACLDPACCAACMLRSGPQHTQVDKQRLVRFFDQKGFYTVHGESALFVAQQYYRTTAVIKYFGSADTGLPGAVLAPSDHAAMVADAAASC